MCYIQQYVLKFQTKKQNINNDYGSKFFAKNVHTNIYRVGKKTALRTDCEIGMHVVLYNIYKTHTVIDNSVPL